MKRRFAIQKARGMVVQAMDEMNSYLSLYMADADAWQELADLYIAEQQCWHNSFFNFTLFPEKV